MLPHDAIKNEIMKELESDWREELTASQMRLIADQCARRIVTLLEAVDREASRG